MPKPWQRIFYGSIHYSCNRHRRRNLRKTPRITLVFEGSNPSSMNGEMVRTRQNPVEEKAREVDFSGFFRDAYVAANGKLPAGLHEGRSNPGMRGRTDPDASQH